METIPERFAVKVGPLTETGCRHWTAATFKTTGYGVWHPVTGVTTTAHRWLWEQLHGQLETGMQVDHACHNLDETCAGGRDCPHRKCVNPDHLRAVPGRDNANASPNANVHKTHCPRRHPYSPQNTYVCGRGTRRCRECARQRDRQRTPRRRNRKGDPHGE